MTCDYFLTVMLVKCYDICKNVKKSVFLVLSRNYRSWTCFQNFSWIASYNGKFSFRWYVYFKINVICNETAPPLYFELGFIEFDSIVIHSFFLIQVLNRKGNNSQCQTISTHICIGTSSNKQKNTTQQSIPRILKGEIFF